MSLIRPGKIEISTNLLCWLMIGNGIVVGIVSYQACLPVMLEGAECLGDSSSVRHEIGYLRGALPGLGALISTPLALLTIALIRSRERKS